MGYEIELGGSAERRDEAVRESAFSQKVAWLVCLPRLMNRSDVQDLQVLV
jgi:hypothetical protein